VSPTPPDVSNPDKVFFPAVDSSAGGTAHDDITKAEVVDYYRRIAAHLLPHAARRPLVLQRFPDGIDGDGFFQKNTPDHVPDWIERVDIPTAEGGRPRYTVLDAAAADDLASPPIRGRSCCMRCSVAPMIPTAPWRSCGTSTRPATTSIRCATPLASCVPCSTTWASSHG